MEEIKASDFQVKAIIGRGHFGVVQVVKHKVTAAVYAMKVLQKSDILAQPEISFYQEERDIMAETTSPWITQLHFAFQDAVSLYLVMEFHAGGDLLSLLSRHDDIFEEEMAKFYVAEMAVAINSLHEMGYLHRDVKPENILLDRTGHVKLADFGSAARMNSNKKVSARMPVGTPDYVAPELLTSLNKGHGRTTYGPEVDWWSLGVCAYEMLYGSTPFTNEHASMVSTYANIMDHKNTLRFPSVSSASSKAKDFIKKLLTDPALRFGWKEIRRHPLFFKMQWENLRDKDAAYVPTLNSLDDTSHFDEVEKVERQPNLNMLKATSDVKEQDKKFKKFDFFRNDANSCQKQEEIPHKVSDSTLKSTASSFQLGRNNSNVLNTAVCLDQSTASTSVLGNESLIVKMSEKDEEIERLRCMLELEKKGWGSLDSKSKAVLDSLNSMNREIQNIEDELLEVRVEEMKSEVVMLETEQEKLTAQLREKDRQIKKLQAALEEAQSQSNRLRVDSSRRVSHENQRKDLELLELRSETWQSLLDDKQAQIEELSSRLHELEGLVEAYEDSEEQQSNQVTQLQHKLNTSIQDIGTSFAITDVRMSGGQGEARVELDDHHHNKCPSKKKLTLHVTLKAGRCSFVDNKTVHQLQDLQKTVDKYTEKARDWREKEEELMSKIANLESDNNVLRQKEGMGRKMKESLMEKVTTYQQEVNAQKSIIRELQETMRSYLNKSCALSDTETQLKSPDLSFSSNQDAQSSKLALESELLAVREEVQKTRQSTLNKANEMEDAIHKLEEQRALAADYKKKYDCQVEATEARVGSLEEQLAKVTSDRQRLERREASLTTQVETLQGLLDDRTVEMEKLERRNTDIQSHLQQLQQRNSELQIEVESLQKTSAKNDQEQKSKAELNFQLTRLQQQNAEFERRITTALRDKQGMEDKVSLVEREKDRLMRRIERLEVVEKKKHELEGQVEKMSSLERENRRLEVKVERLTAMEKEKLNLEEKIEKLQMDLRREKVNIETLTSEKAALDSKMKQLSCKQESDKNSEVSQLKMKVTLLETVEKEKERLEHEVAKRREEATTSKRDVERLEKDKSKVEREKDTLEKEKRSAENQLETLKKEKSSLDEQVAKLNKEMDRLEGSVGKLQLSTAASNNTDVQRLSCEVNRLKQLVDRLESERAGKERNPRISGSDVRSGLVERLQREKSELQRRVESLEKQSPRRTSEWRGAARFRQDGDEKCQKLEAELAELKTKLKSFESEAGSEKKNAAELEEMKKKNQNLENEGEAVKWELEESKKSVAELKSRLEVQTANVAELRAQLEEQMKMEGDLITQLEKEAKKALLLKEEKEKLEVQLKDNKTTEAVKLPQRSVAEAIARDRQLGQLRQEKEELEQRVAQLQRQVAQAKVTTETPLGSRKSGEAKFEKLQLESKIQELTEERDQLQRKLNVRGGKEDNNSSEATAELAQLKQELEETRRELEIRKGASEFPGGDIPAYLKHELNESNLALSEARSLLAANKRQEIELRDRIDKLQRIIDNKAVENGKYLQNSQDAMSELKNLRSQHDTLQRQYKVLEDKHASLQREKGSDSSETVRLMEDMNSKQQQLEVEMRKVEKLTRVCKELEEQVQDMEAGIAEAQQRQADWDNIKKSYEAAMDRSQASNVQVSSMQQQFESQKAFHQAELEKLQHSLREERAHVKKLTDKLTEFQEKERASTCILESQGKEMEKFTQEKLKFKEELTELLSDNCALRKENVKLGKHLQDAMDKFEIIIGEKVSLENFTEALQGLHFLDKYKLESTIGQQQKLIDHVQGLFMEHTAGKKKKNGKLFGGGGGKSGKDGASTLPLSWTDQQTALEQERGKSTQLQEQVDRLREENFHQANELLKLKALSREMDLEGDSSARRGERGSGTLQDQQRNSRSSSSSREPEQGHGRLQANLTVKLTQSAMEALSNPPGSSGHSRQQHQGAHSLAGSMASLASNASSSSSSSSYSSSSREPRTPRTPHHGSRKNRGGGGHTPWASEPLPTPQRMNHNIPHRFATGLNTRATKCGLCLGSVHFVKQASKCQECGMVVHPKCASSVPATCGLPTEYVRHFALMMSCIYRDEAGQQSDVDQSAVKMEGWLKVPRLGKSGWENRYCVLEGTWLTLYLDDTDASPVDSFDLNPMDAEVSVHSAVTSAELSNTAASDLHYVLRLDQDPLTTCWPGRYLYLMTTNFQEKQRWVASLEAVVKSAQCKSDLYRNRSQMLTVLSLKEEERRDFNCTLVISSQLVLAGTDDGLYAFNPSAMTSKRKQMTQISGFGSVHQMILAKGVDLIVILTGPERRLVLLENKLVKCRMSQTLGGETTPFSFRTIEGLQCCTIFDVGLWNNASYLCVGTPTKVYLMKYNPSLAMYCVRKEFPSSEPCSCVCIAENYAIVGTERFYKINLEHPSMLDFVDRQDQSLAFAAYGAANHNSFPLSVVRVSPDDLPLEFLLCFHEFGVFVDHHGQRSRTSDVKWGGLPLAFAFIEPFLYVTYCNTVHATVVPTDRTQAKGRQTVIDVQSPRCLGPAPSFGCVYISSSNNAAAVTEIIRIRGQEGFVSETPNDKENMGSTRSLTDRQVQFASPAKTRVHRLKRQGSLSSLNSNSSVGTHASIESDV
ncbi:citron Rho-interacting kinase isoform X2 [Aplysia californica]|uniref:non-specific serine/threonine protein kinase n=1 Tax=Aplysia californica TaxID=6500 RepID=A0ABM1AFP0_APLCA|nr:citron Rho-interacting kinase isoform X2 [Aplysia californica]